MAADQHQAESLAAARRLRAVLKHMGVELPTVEPYPFPAGPDNVPMVSLGRAPAALVDALAERLEELTGRRPGCD
ncbi:hypothetical protein [Kitasatospora sp. NPDC088346]|uniref:hypothetical protein n=1 Tax=Kitasatospora sp. NPDC088346 TaxID=3364073 RepID=UPI003806E37D